jgi:hypothetical protein
VLPPVIYTRQGQCERQCQCQHRRARMHTRGSIAEMGGTSAQILPAALHEQVLFVGNVIRHNLRGNRDRQKRPKALGPWRLQGAR